MYVPRARTFSCRTAMQPLHPRINTDRGRYLRRILKPRSGFARCPVVFSAAEWPSSGWCLASSCQISSFAPRLSSVNAPPHTSPWCFWRLRAGYHVDCLSEWFVSFLTIRFKLCLFSRKIPETLPCLSRRISWEAWFRSHYWWCLSRSLGEGDVCPASPL